MSASGAGYNDKVMYGCMSGCARAYARRADKCLCYVVYGSSGQAARRPRLYSDSCELRVSVMTTIARMYGASAHASCVSMLRNARVARARRRCCNAMLMLAANGCWMCMRAMSMGRVCRRRCKRPTMSRRVEQEWLGQMMMYGRGTAR